MDKILRSAPRLRLYNALDFFDASNSVCLLLIAVYSHISNRSRECSHESRINHI